MGCAHSQLVSGEFAMASAAIPHKLDRMYRVHGQCLALTICCLFWVETWRRLQMTIFGNFAPKVEIQTRSKGAAWAAISIAGRSRLIPAL